MKELLYFFYYAINVINSSFYFIRNIKSELVNKCKKVKEKNAC